MREFYITDRDQKILEYLHQNKVALREHLHEQFFNGVSVRIVNRRLALLLDHGYISRGAVSIDSRALSYYQITTKGFMNLKKLKQFSTILRTERSESIEHDLSLISVRKVLSLKKRIAEYLTENMLNCDSTYSQDKKYKYFISLQSDAVCDVQFSKGNFNLAIEYESHAKANVRYEEKFLNYYNTDIQAVIYICESKNLMANLKKIDKGVCKAKNFSSKIYFCLMDELKNSSSMITFSNFANQSISVE